MIKTEEDIVAAALRMSAERRASLADKLLASLPEEQRVDLLWAQEAEDRIAAFEGGFMEAIPGDLVFRELGLEPDET